MKTVRIHRRMFLRRLGAGAAGLGAAALLPGCSTLRALAGGGLPRSTPEAEGLPSGALLDFLAAAHGKFELHSLMVLRHGRVVAEGWWAPYGPDRLHTLYSLSKSFTSTAVGLAAAEGRLTVDDRVATFFPDRLPAAVSDHLAALRIKDLLSMAVGSGKEPTRDMVQEDDWVKFFLAAPITHAPGSVFMYNSAATYMCSAIVQQVTGQRVVDYLRPRLFDPLGIGPVTWETCPRGINTGGWGLSVRTEDLARFAQLYLQKGQWQGRQILPAAWVAEATAKHIQQPLPDKPARQNEQNDWVQGYGYQFWRCTHGGFRGDGAFGQFAVVLPEQDAVVVMTAESHNLQGQLDLVWSHLLPAMQKAPLPADSSGRARMDAALQALALPLPAGVAAPAALPSRIFKLAGNALGLQSAAFAFRPDGVDVTFRTADRAHVLPVGCGRWGFGSTGLPGTPPRLISGGSPPPGTPFAIAAAGAWKDDHTFEFALRYIDTPHRDTVTCAFSRDGGAVEIRFANSISPDTRPVLQGT